MSIIGNSGMMITKTSNHVQHYRHLMKQEKFPLQFLTNRIKLLHSRIRKINLSQIIHVSQLLKMKITQMKKAKTFPTQLMDQKRAEFSET